MADQAGAAIRRATQAAHHAMRQLDAEAVAELARIYAEAADQVRAQIRAAAAAGGAGRVRLEQLRPLLAAIEDVLSALASARTQVLDAAIGRAAELGVRPLTAGGLAATGRAVGLVVDGAQALQVVDQAVNMVRSFTGADGLVLSDRLWRVDRGAREAVTRLIEQAVVQGWSADRAATEFLMRGQAVPPATAAARAAADVDQVLTGADYLQDQKGGALASSLRVMRTEINRAHGEAYMAAAARAPGFAGFRYLLSPQHPGPDICDLYSTQNVHGLGAGVYPDRKSCPWPAHPSTLSFVVAVFDEEISDADRAGRETTLQALARLAPEVREGVLGQTKAGYFDQGLLTRGMLRSRARDVTARLQRTGRLP